MSMAQYHQRDCRHFNGYKPCFPGVNCSDHCQFPDPMGTRILIVNLDAMGDVLMTTAQLPALKKEYPQSYLSWITHGNAASLLSGNPFLDRVYVWNEENRLVLQQQHFDLVLNADKAVPACAFVKSLTASEVRGFTLSERGQIIPANNESMYSFNLGLDDQMKFRINERTGQEILAESWELPYEGDEYTLVLTRDEQKFCEEKRREWKLVGKVVVAFNTGCSELFPNKKLTIEQHVSLIDIMSAHAEFVFLLLGGREDTERNAEIARRCAAHGERVISTPTTEGLRRGICYENLADIVITGDTLGMHLAIGLKKYVLAWFGLSCQAEIDLYGRGEKFFQRGLDCSPCWKRVCPNNLECRSMISPDSIADAVWRYAVSHLLIAGVQA